MVYTNWMKIRLNKLVEVREKLIKAGFSFEIGDIATGVEETLQLEIDTGYMLQVNIHHTWVDWYFTLWIDQKQVPLAEEKFWSVVNRYIEYQKQEKCFHWWLPQGDRWGCEWCGKKGDLISENTNPRSDGESEAIEKCPGSNQGYGW